MFDRLETYLRKVLLQAWKRPLLWGPILATLVLILPTAQPAYALANNPISAITDSIKNYWVNTGQDAALRYLQATASGFLNMILQALGAVAAAISGFASNWMELIAGASSSVFAMDAIKTLWNLAIGAANSIFLLALLAMSIAIMLRKAGGYDFKKAFSMLLVAILGANATFLIVQSLDALARFFTNLMPTVFGQGATSIADNPVFDLPAQLATSFSELLGEVGYQHAPYYTFIFAIVIVWVTLWSVIRALAVLVERLVQLVVQMLLGPFIFAFSLFSGNDNAIKKWFADLFNWALVLPLTFFFFTAAAVFFQQFDAKEIASLFVDVGQTTNTTALAPADTTNTFALNNPFAITPAAAADNNLPTAEENPLAPLMFLAVGLYLIWYAGRAHELVVKASEFTAKALGGLDKYAVKAGLGAAGFAGLTAVNLPTNFVGGAAERLGRRFKEGSVPAKLFGNVARIKNLGTQTIGAGRFAKEYAANYAKEAFQKPIDKSKSNLAQRVTRGFDESGGAGEWLGKGVPGFLGGKGLAKNLMRAGRSIAKIERDDAEEILRNPRKALDLLKDSSEAPAERALAMQAMERFFTNRTIDPEFRKELALQLKDAMKDAGDDFDEIHRAAKNFAYETTTEFGGANQADRIKALDTFIARIDHQIKTEGGVDIEGVPDFQNASPNEQAARYGTVLGQEYADIDQEFNLNNAFAIPGGASSAEEFDRIMRRVQPADLSTLTPRIARGLAQLLGGRPERVNQVVATIQRAANKNLGPAIRDNAKASLINQLQNMDHFRGADYREVQKFADRLVEGYDARTGNTGLLHADMGTLTSRFVSAADAAHPGNPTQADEQLKTVIDRLRRYDVIQNRQEGAVEEANKAADLGRNTRVVMDALQHGGYVDAAGTLLPGQRARLQGLNQSLQNVNESINALARQRTQAGNYETFSNSNLNALGPAGRARVTAALTNIGVPPVALNDMTVARAQELLRSGINQTNRTLNP